MIIFIKCWGSMKNTNPIFSKVVNLIHGIVNLFALSNSSEGMLFNMPSGKELFFSSRILFRSIVLMILILFSYGFGFAQYAGGIGTQSNPYQIQNWKHLQNVSLNPQSYFILTASLSPSSEGYAELAGPQANGGKGWSPIHNFRGRIYGNGHVIEDLYINRPFERGQGLFKQASNAEFHRIQLRNAFVMGFEDAGALVGVGINILVSGCSFSGSVTGTTYVGGLLGTIGSSKISDSYSLGTVKGTKLVGGLIGNTYQTQVVRSFSSGDVVAKKDAGGLIGMFQSMSYHQIENCYSTARIDSEEGIGGLVASMSGGQISQSYFAGSVSEKTLAGGLVGLVMGKAQAFNSFWDKKSIPSATNSELGEEISAVLLRSADFFEERGWDFDASWSIHIPSMESQIASFPYLQSIAYDPIDLDPAHNPIPGLINIALLDLDFASERSVRYGEAPIELGPDSLDSIYYSVRYFTDDTTVVRISGNQAVLLQAGTALVFAQVENGFSPVKQQTLQVNPAILKIKTDTATKIYGESDPEITFSVEGWKNSDSDSLITGNPVRKIGENAGFYPIEKGTLDAGHNYQIEFVPSQLEIKKRGLQVIALPKEKYCGDPDPEFTFQVSGLVAEGENQEFLKGALSRQAGEQAGKYLIQVGSLEANPNYDISFVSDTLTIKAPLLISFREIPTVSTPWGLAPEMPKQGEFLTQSGTWVSLGLTWDLSFVDFFKKGEYTAKARVTSPNFEVAEGFYPTLSVRVLPKSAPEDLILHLSPFSEKELGTLEVIDASDSIHSIRLVATSTLHGQIELKGNLLRWKNTAQSIPSSGLELDIELEDRDGNQLRKKFFLHPTARSQRLGEEEIINSFSPNGDGVNDTWIPLPGYQFEEWLIRVVDNSGKLVFFSKSIGDRWDGTSQGRQVPEGTYYWMLEAKGTSYRGALNLIRGN